MTAPAPAAPTPSVVPAAAPAESCGAPETRPAAMRGQKMARPIRVRAPSTTAKACSIVMSSGSSAVRSVANMVEPMPMTIAITSTLMPDEMTLPRTRSARKVVCRQKANGHQDEAGQRRQLELDDQDEELDRQHEEGGDDDDAADAEQDDLGEIAEELERTRRDRADVIEDRLRGREAFGRDQAGPQEIGRRRSRRPTH